MKETLPLRRFDVGSVVRSGLKKEISNVLPIHRSASYITLDCPVCALSFRRKGSEAKRHAVNYCGKACAGCGCRKQVAVKCKICGIEFTVKQSHVGKITCCGKKCKSELLSLQSASRKLMIDYRVGWRRPARFSPEQVCAIRRMRTENVTLQRIAVNFGVTRPAIAMIVYGRSYGYVNCGDTQKEAA